jgi:hypothetical protein
MNTNPNQPVEGEKTIEINIDPTAAMLGTLQHNQAMLRTIMQLQVQILAQIEGKTKPEDMQEYQKKVNAVLNDQLRFAAQDMMRYQVQPKK